MKILKRIAQYTVLGLTVGCTAIISSDDSPMPQDDPLNSGLEAIKVPESFDYATTLNADLNVSVLDNKNNGLVGVTFDLHKPGDEGWELIGKAATDQDGRLAFNVPIATAIEYLLLETSYIGLPQQTIISTDQLHEKLIIGGARADNVNSSAAPTNGRLLGGPIPVGDYWLLDEYDNQGVPYNLMEIPDYISQDMLDLINSSLPERRPVPIYNPEYLDDNIQTNTLLGDSAEVWVTFVHEGAGWTNSLGYYTYPLDNPPTSVDEIDSMFIIFPNVSFKGHGGNLMSGDKVCLGSFTKRTGIGWFLIPRGWTGSQVIDRSEIKYSDKSFNSFTAQEYRQHTVLLKDDARELLLLGMEDTSRPGGDNDFNDAVFYVTASPYTAIITDDLESTKTDENPDRDGDGVSDINDDYPDDPDKAFTIYTPGEATFGSLAFEDQWPSKGDYDMNDMVIDYNFKFVTNTANKAVLIETVLRIRAVGGQFHNGFGIELPVSSGLISSVSTNDPNLSLSTEEGSISTSIMIFEDAHDMMSASGHLNTVSDQSKIDIQELRFSINFVEPIAMASLGYAPFNPFITVNGDRTVEIHLPDKTPTPKADISLLGTQHDKSNPGTGLYYKSYNNLPWAINLPESFDYPVEFKSIDQAHLMFKAWAESGGTQNKDWYKPNNGYRNDENIYK